MLLQIIICRSLFFVFFILNFSRKLYILYIFAHIYKYKVNWGQIIYLLAICMIYDVFQFLNSIKYLHSRI